MVVVCAYRRYFGPDGARAGRGRSNANPRRKMYSKERLLQRDDTLSGPIQIIYLASRISVPFPCFQPIYTFVSMPSSHCGAEIRNWFNFDWSKGIVLPVARKQRQQNAAVQACVSIFGVHERACASTQVRVPERSLAPAVISPR